MSYYVDLSELAYIDFSNDALIEEAKGFLDLFTNANASPYFYPFSMRGSAFIKAVEDKNGVSTSGTQLRINFQSSAVTGWVAEHIHDCERLVDEINYRMTQSRVFNRDNNCLIERLNEEIALFLNQFEVQGLTSAQMIVARENEIVQSLKLARA